MTQNSKDGDGRGNVVPFRQRSALSPSSPKPTIRRMPSISAQVQVSDAGHRHDITYHPTRETGRPGDRTRIESSEVIVYRDSPRARDTAANERKDATARGKLGRSGLHVSHGLNRGNDLNNRKNLYLTPRLANQVVKARFERMRDNWLKDPDVLAIRQQSTRVYKPDKKGYGDSVPVAEHLSYTVHRKNGVSKPFNVSIGHIKHPGGRYAETMVSSGQNPSRDEEFARDRKFRAKNGQQRKCAAQHKRRAKKRDQTKTSRDATQRKPRPTGVRQEKGGRSITRNDLRASTSPSSGNTSRPANVGKRLPKPALPSTPSPSRSPQGPGKGGRGR